MILKSSKYLDIYDLVREIPKGRVSTYGALAKYLGKGYGARIVGWALNNCHNQPDIPAHRVVNRNGLLSGHIHFGEGNMQRLLELEGIVVQNMKIVDFNFLFWDPSVELL